MPKTAATKNNRIDLRVTPEQKALLEQAASLKGISLSAYSKISLIKKSYCFLTAIEIY
jgi:uncharacterized protein (DUF1778 family)